MIKLYKKYIHHTHTIGNCLIMCPTLNGRLIIILHIITREYHYVAQSHTMVKINIHINIITKEARRNGYFFFF